MVVVVVKFLEANGLRGDLVLVHRFSMNDKGISERGRRGRRNHVGCDEVSGSDIDWLRERDGPTQELIGDASNVNSGNVALDHRVEICIPHVDISGTVDDFLEALTGVADIHIGGDFDVLEFASSMMKDLCDESDSHPTTKSSPLLSEHDLVLCTDYLEHDAIK